MPIRNRPKKATGGGRPCSVFCEIGDLAGSGRPYNMRDTHSIKWMANRRDLTVPYFWILIAATDAAFLAILGGPVMVWKWIRKRCILAPIRASARVSQIVGGLVAISTGSSGNQ